MIDEGETSTGQLACGCLRVGSQASSPVGHLGQGHFCPAPLLLGLGVASAPGCSEGPVSIATNPTKAVESRALERWTQLGGGGAHR